MIGSQKIETSQRRPARRAALAALAGAAFLVQGCATSGNPKDPLEGFNRAMFALNEGIDKVVARPLARGYETVVPLPGRTVVGNVFSNLSDPWIGVNNLLQGTGSEAVSDLGRVVINSTIGILGTFDIASEMGLEKHDEDFGQTLGPWTRTSRRSGRSSQAGPSGSGPAWATLPSPVSRAGRSRSRLRVFAGGDM